MAASAAGGLSCVYHSSAVKRPCVSLRDFVARPPPLQCRRSSRSGSAVLDRSAELRAAGAGGSGGSEGAAAAPLASLPPAAPCVDHLQLSPAQQQQATHDILHAFLATARISNSNGSSQSHSHGSSSAEGLPRRRHQRQQPTGKAVTLQGQQQQQLLRGLQGRVVEHLLGGGFDEAMLQGVPTHTLNWVVKVLGQQGEPVLAEQLYHWMRVTGRANEHSFVKLCEACGASQQPWRAFHAWRTTRRVPQARRLVGSHAAAALVLAYRSTADQRGALQALADLQSRGVRVDRYAFNAAIRVCADAGDADEALRLVARLREAAAAVAAAAERQQGQQAQQQQGQRDSPLPLPLLPGRQQPQPPSASSSASSSSSVGNSSAASTTPAAAVPSQGEPGGGLRPDCRTYSAALAAVAAAGKWNRTPQLHRWMVEDGVAPDAPLLTQLLAGLAAVGQAGAAQQLFDAAAAGPPQGGSPQPNSSHWNALLLAYAESADVPGCTAAYRRMLASGRRPDAHSLVALLRAAYLTEAGLPAVQAVRAEAKRHGVRLTLQLGTAMLACLRHVGGPPPGQAAAWQQLRGAAAPGGRGAAGQQHHAPAQQQQQRCAALPALAASGVVASAPGQWQDQHPPARSAAVAAGAGAEAEAAAALGASAWPPHTNPPQAAAAAAVLQPEGGGAGSGPGSAAAQSCAACLAEARSLFAELSSSASSRRSRPLDVRAYNALLAVQLAAGDYAGVVQTFEKLEAEEQRVLPDGATLAAVIAACRAAGWEQRAAQYEQLLHSSRLLGALGRRQRTRTRVGQPAGGATPGQDGGGLTTAAYPSETKP